ncbi:hypothetical protein TCAP_00321 [Tolypocladium capitatum]|uniref:Uncharacterized protein n=1 Tax=Tolypocladium capitatum TaxID=45235 RepID=A0A2K3QQF1_9HYPO|nr:hypothetical protein TCAP_00321 [Tolypocladium capitatum]
MDARHLDRIRTRPTRQWDAAGSLRTANGVAVPGATGYGVAEPASTTCLSTQPRTPAWTQAGVSWREAANVGYLAGTLYGLAAHALRTCPECPAVQSRRQTPASARCLGACTARVADLVEANGPARQPAPRAERRRRLPTAQQAPEPQPPPPACDLA